MIENIRKNWYEFILRDVAMLRRVNGTEQRKVLSVYLKTSRQHQLNIN